MYRFVDLDKLKIVEINSTEKIDRKDIQRFIKTNLKNQNIKIEHHNHYFYNYCDRFGLYQVFVLKKELFKNIVIEPYIFSVLFNKKDIYLNSNTLIITDRYTVIYTDGKMSRVFLNSLSNSQDDVINYLKQQKITIDEIKRYKKNKIESFKQKFKTNKIKNLDRLKEKSRWLYLVVVLFIFISFFAIDDDIGIKIKEQIVQKPKLKAIVDDEALLDDMWLKTDDVYKGYIVKKIDKTKTVLDKNKTKIELKIKND